MPKTILVTGAAGFIGSHVSQAFLRRGDFVVGLDNLNDYYDPLRKRANLAEVGDLGSVISYQRTVISDQKAEGRGHEVPERSGVISGQRAEVREQKSEGRSQRATDGRFTFVEGDVRDRRLLDELFAGHRFDAVVHLAAMAGVRVSIEDPHLYYDVNLTGTLNLLEAARQVGLGNFVLASTSSVYGRTERIPFEESDTCDRPLAPYPASKRAAEMLGYAYHHLHGQSFTALRFFTVYGPRGRPDMMAYKVLDNIFYNKPVPLFNGGRMHRDWTYVDDIAAGVVAAADRPLGYEVINLGRGEPTLLADFVALIEDLAGRKATLSDAPMPDADIGYTYADIARARRLLGYDPQVSVAEGVARFWDWYQGAVLQADPTGSRQ